MDSPTTTAAHGRMPSLDGLRAVSILLVVMCHAAGTVKSPVPASARWYFGQGGVGVDVFFVISGFLITTLLMREQERTGSVSLRGFYTRRALRILPAFVAYLGVVAVLDRLGWVQLLRRDWIAASTYTVNFFKGISFPVGHIWSLSVEEHFYLLWPPLLVVLGIQRAARVALGFLLAEPLIRWITYKYGGGVFDIDYVTFTRLDGIAAGCLMAVIAQSTGASRILRRVDARPTLWFVAGMCTLGLSVLVLGQSGKYTIVAKPFVNAIAIGLMIWTATRFPGTSFGRVLNWAPLAWVGRLSYSLYIWQQLFLGRADGQLWISRFPQNVGLSFLAAIASYYLVELPFLRLKRRASTADGAAATVGAIAGASASARAA